MAHLNKRRILLIDDQASIHEDYRKIIGASSSVKNRLDDTEVELFGGVRPQLEKTECYEIDSAFSGEEAIRLVERSLEEGQPYAVAFVDIRMPPGIDGVKTMRRIWQIDSEILAVMCSAYSDYSWEAIVSELGRTESFLILRKPFDTVEVRQCAAALSGRWTVSRTDALTGLLNRRSFREHLRREWAVAIRNERPLSCVMIDIDHFKSVTDQYGLTVADKLLTVVASVLAGEIRRGDVLSRYSGEQFCVLLPAADLTEALQWAEHVRQSIAGQPFHVSGHEMHFTASFGVANRTSAWQEDLIERADEALQAAREAGRDRVVAWTPATPGKENQVHSELSRLAEAFGHTPPEHDEIQRLLKYSRLFDKVTAQDIMTPPVVCIPRNTPGVEAANILLRRQASSAPVTNPDGSLAGMVSERDIMLTVGVSDNWNAPVERFMSEGVIQYTPSTPASVIFDFLCRVQIHRVVIVDDLKPVGLIGRGTFLRWAENHLSANQSSRGGSGQQSKNVLRSTDDELFNPVIAELQSVQEVLAELASWSRENQDASEAETAETEKAACRS